MHKIGLCGQDAKLLNINKKWFTKITTVLHLVSCYERHISVRNIGPCALSSLDIRYDQ